VDPRLFNKRVIECWRQTPGGTFEHYELTVVDYLEASQHKPGEWSLDPPPGGSTVRDLYPTDLRDNAAWRLDITPLKKTN